LHLHGSATRRNSPSKNLARTLLHGRNRPFSFWRIRNGESPAQVNWLDFHLTGWFEFIESGAPYRTKLGTTGRKYTPYVVELLRKAIVWQTLFESGEIANQADIARRESITRARVTQVMGMLRLAPEIRQRILSMPDGIGRPSVTERMVRRIGVIQGGRFFY
jgi:hypothetical protein